MVQDITARKLAEVALRDQNARLSRVVETQAEIAAADLELDGVSQLIAERAQELTGADGARVSILDGEDLLTAASVGDMDSSPWVSVPLLHRGRNVGSLGVVKEAGVNGEDRRTLELLAVLLSSAVSVAAEREARREQVEALARFETIFEQAPIGIGLVSLDGRLVNTNSVMRDISGRSAEELASRNVGEYTCPRTSTASSSSSPQCSWGSTTRTGTSTGSIPRTVRSFGSTRPQHFCAMPTGSHRAQSRWPRTSHGDALSRSSSASRRRSTRSDSSRRGSRTTSTTSCSACSATPSWRRPGRC